MIVNIETYRCPKCKKFYNFDKSKEYSVICSNCNVSMNYFGHYSKDTDNKQKVPEMQPKQYFQYVNNKPTITCPYCQSTNTKKIGIVSRSTSFSLFGFGSSKVGKQWHCNNCKSDF